MVRIAVVVALSAACTGGGSAPSAPPGGGGGPPAPPKLTTFAVGIAPQSVEVGLTAQAVASGADAAGNPIATGPVTWSASPVQVATVSPAGLVTTLAPGAVAITGAAGGFTASTSLTVTTFTIPPARLRILPDAVELTIGVQSQLRAVRITGNDTTSIGAPIWDSSAPSIAAVSAAGRVTALTPGLAIIRGSAGGLSGSVAVQVVARVDTTIKVHVAAPLPGSLVGDTLRIICTVGSSQDMQGVIATIDAFDTALDTVHIGALGGTLGWGKEIALKTVPIGIHRLVITAHARDGAISADTLFFDREVPDAGGTLPVGGKKRVTPVGGTIVRPPSKPKRPAGPP